MKIRNHLLLNDEPGAGGGGEAAAATATSPAPAADATTTPAIPAAADPAATTPANKDEPAAAAKTALNAGADEWAPSKVPEKYQVKNDKGELDVNATFRKVEEHRDQLEKRLGAGGIRPKTADDYKLPDTDTFKALQLDEVGTKTFRGEAHEMGLSQTQYEKVMEKYASLAPQLVNAGQEITAAETITTLTGIWKDDTNNQLAGAYDVAQKLAGRAGVSFAEMDAAIGNNPVAIRLLASLSKEMREDATPAGANGDLGGSAPTIDTLLAHPAYSDSKHPEHKVISERVRKHYEKTTPKDD